MGAVGALDMLLQFLLERVARLPAGLEHDGGLDHLAAKLVRRGGDGSFQHGRVLQQRAFHLEGAPMR